MPTNYTLTELTTLAHKFILNFRMEKEFDAITTLIEWISESSSIVVLTGPETSEESAIPDITSSTLNPDIKHFKNKKEVRKEYWRKMKQLYPLIENATPNPTHTAIYELTLLSNISCIMTQCVDSLLRKAGCNEVLELYSNIHWVTCTQCGKDQSMVEALSQIEKGEEIPKCPVCSSDKIKPPISFPGQPLPHWEIREAWIKLHNCDLFIAVGANFAQEPIASFPLQVMDKGGKAAIISEKNCKEDEFVHAVIYGKPSQVMQFIVEKLKEKITIS